MTIRIAFIGAATFLLAASSAASQGRPAQQVVLSQGVMKAIGASKPKTKSPLTAKVGMVRRSRVVAAKPAPAAPTSVGQIVPASTRK